MGGGVVSAIVPPSSDSLCDILEILVGLCSEISRHYNTIRIGGLKTKSVGLATVKWRRGCGRRGLKPANVGGKERQEDAQNLRETKRMPFRLEICQFQCR